MTDGYCRYLRLKQALETDEEYRMLDHRRTVLQPIFMSALDTFTEEQKDANLEYLGICGEMQLRETEIACFLP